MRYLTDPATAAPDANPRAHGRPAPAHPGFRSRPHPGPARLQRLAQSCRRKLLPDAPLVSATPVSARLMSAMLLNALLMSAMLATVTPAAADSGGSATGAPRPASAEERDSVPEPDAAPDAGRDALPDTEPADAAAQRPAPGRDAGEAAASGALSATDPGTAGNPPAGPDTDTDTNPEADPEADPEAAPRDASAAQDSAWEPTPFSASYEARYDGVPFTATGTRTLEIDEDGLLQFSSRVHTWLLKLDEEATMEVSAAGHLRPLDYAYRVRGVASRARDLEFDWDAGMVHRTGRNARSAPLEAPAYDPVSWQLALQRDLARGAREPGTVLRYPIADGGDVKVYEIIVRGPEQIELATGTEQTVFLERLHENDDERSTRVWLAPERDWLLVKLEVVDDDGRMLRLSLKP